MQQLRFIDPVSRPYISFIFSLFIALSLLVALLAPKDLSAADAPFVLDKGWEYRWGDSPFNANGIPQWSVDDSDQGAWNEIDFPSNPPGRNGQRNVWYRTTLPDGEWRDPIIYIFSVDLITEVYLDGKKIYNYGTFDKDGQGQFEGWPWHMISLPSNYAGKDVYFRIYSSYSDIGLWGEVKLMERLDLFKYIISNSMDKIVISGITFLIALMALIFALAQPDRRIYFLISAFTTSTATMLFSQSQAKQLIFKTPLIWDHITATSYFILPIVMAMLFGAWCQERFQKLIKGIWIFHSAFAIFAIGGSIIGFLELSTMFEVFDGLLTVSLIMLFFIAFSQFKKVSGQVKVIILAFAIFSLFLLVDMGVAHNFLPWTRMPIAWGLLIFSIVLIVVSVRHFALTQKALKDFNLTLERRVKDRTLQLSESEALLQSMYHRTPVMLHSIDPQGLLLSVSNYWLSSMGYEEDEVLGRPSLNFLTPESQQYAREVVLPQFFKQGHCENIAYQFVRKDGSVFDGSLSAVLERDSYGNPLQTLAVTVDVTERNYAETQLSSAKETAEHADIAKTKFLATASHDLRQPLQAAHLFLDILSAKDHQPESREVINHLNESIDALGSLLDSLLDISRLEAGLVKADKQTFSLSKLISRLAKEYSQIANDVGVEVRSVAAQLFIHSDPVLLETILRNLLSNAINHSGRGKVLFGCRRHGDSITLEVWDNGCGIPENRLDDIFGEFVQIGNEGRDRTKGLGLGLSIVKKLSDILDHRIDARSWEGRGSAFTIELPLELEGAVSETSEKDLAAKPFAKISIFVIDDEPAIRIALSQVLEQNGYEVYTSSGYEFHESMKITSEMTSPPDIIIADFRLQYGHTGIDAIKYVRETFKEDIPAILLTGDTAPDRLTEAKNSDLSLLHKPVKVDELIQAISSAIKAG